MPVVSSQKSILVHMQLDGQQALINGIRAATDDLVKSPTVIFLENAWRGLTLQSKRQEVLVDQNTLKLLYLF
jgi:hypothetical protein